MRISSSRSAAVGFLALVLISPYDVRADAVPCPVQQATWAVSTPLPDPWQSTPQAGALKDQVGAFINGKQWIICRYADPGKNTVFASSPESPTIPGIEPPANRLTIFRPSIINAPSDTVSCPFERVTTEVTTKVPAPWTGTTYVWKRVYKDNGEIGGQAVIRCHYTYEGVDHDVWGAGPSALLRPLEPDAGPPLGANPTPRPPRPGSFVAEFAVTEATLSTDPEVRANCPAKVRYTGSITANGKGEVIYRIVHNGVRGEQRKLDFGQAGRRPVVADFVVGSASRRPPPKPAGAPGSIATAPSDPDRVTGSARIEILRPQGGVVRSDDVNYAVRCVASPDRMQVKRPTP